MEADPNCFAAEDRDPNNHSNHDFHSLLREVRRHYHGDNAAIRIIDWYASIFGPDNITRVLNTLQRTSRAPPPVQELSSNMPKALRDVSQTAAKLLGWELAGNFLHVFQLLYYASFWNEWTRLEILSHDKTSLEAIYLNAQAKKQRADSTYEGPRLGLRRPHIYNPGNPGSETYLVL